MKCLKNLRWSLTTVTMVSCSRLAGHKTLNISQPFSAFITAGQHQVGINTPTLQLHGLSPRFGKSGFLTKGIKIKFDFIFGKKFSQKTSLNQMERSKVCQAARVAHLNSMNLMIHLASPQSFGEKERKETQNAGKMKIYHTFRYTIT